MQIYFEIQKIVCRCASKDCNRFVKAGEKAVKSVHRELRPITYHPECFIQKAEEAIDKIYNGY